MRDRLRPMVTLALLLGAAAPADTTVALTTQPGSALENTAMQLVAADLKQSRSAGDPPVMLVGSAHLSINARAPAALFVQVQSASFCGSAGCSTSVYVKHDEAWTKVMDSISGPIKLSRRSHHGMHDLLVHGHDRWVWNGTTYADTLPTPDVDLRHSIKKGRRRQTAARGVAQRWVIAVNRLCASVPEKPWERSPWTT